MKRSLYLSSAFIAVMLFLASAALAFGPHDDECLECHSIHKAQGAVIIGVKPLTNVKNPATGASLSGNSTLCLGCHNEDEGIMPIDLKKTHPVGMKPDKVKVPAEYISKDGTLVCRSCHDPHPSNPNFKYLTADTNGGKKMGTFCGVCHADKRGGKEEKKAPAPPPKKK